MAIVSGHNVWCALYNGRHVSRAVCNGVTVWTPDYIVGVCSSAYHAFSTDYINWKIAVHRHMSLFSILFHEGKWFTCSAQDISRYDVHGKFLDKIDFNDKIVNIVTSNEYVYLISDKKLFYFANSTFPACSSRDLSGHEIFTYCESFKLVNVSQTTGTVLLAMDRDGLMLRLQQGPSGTATVHSSGREIDLTDIICLDGVWYVRNVLNQAYRSDDDGITWVPTDAAQVNWPVKDTLPEKATIPLSGIKCVCIRRK